MLTFPKTLLIILFIFRFNARRKLSLGSRLGMTKSVSNLHKFKSVSDSKIDELKTRQLKRQTFNKMQWGVRAHQSWRDDKIKNCASLDMKVFDANLENLGSLHKSDLCHALTKFIPEVTKLNGDDYRGKSLYEMVVSIQKFLNQYDLAWKLIDEPEFLDIKTVLDNVMKEWVKANIGTT